MAGSFIQKVSIMKISKRAAGISPSLTLALTAKAKALKADGIDVVSFGAGEPDFDTPDFIKNVAIEDLQKGVTKYSAVRGGPEVIKAIVSTLKRDYSLDYEENQILLSVGGKHSLFNICMALVDDGDEVIVPAPYWLTYPEQIKACGGVPVYIECGPDQNFKATAEQLRNAITSKTVAVIINSPSNPTGAVYTKEELLAIGEVLKDNPHVTLVSDDLYQKLVYAPAEFHSLVTLMPELKNQTIIINGLSKAYAMTGWRLGWAAGPADVMKAAANIQGQSTSNVTSFTQRAAATALMSDHEFLVEWKAQFLKRRDLLVSGLNEIDGINCAVPEGAFYVFPDVSGTFGKKINGREIKDSMSFSEILLEEANVSVVPGVAFGEDRCVRLSYATSEAQILKGLERLKAALA